MNSPHEPSSRRNILPDQSRVRWSGSLFERRPFARWLLKWFLLVALVGYCALIALANSQQWGWLGTWLDLWVPVVEALRHVIPLFDNFERELVAKGFGHRVAIIHHLLAYEWIMSTLIFAFVAVTALRLPREDWIRFVTLVPVQRRAGALLAGLFLLILSLYWVVFGFGFTFEMPQYALHRYDGALILISAYFLMATASAISVLISLQSLKFDESGRSVE